MKMALHDKHVGEYELTRKLSRIIFIPVGYFFQKFVFSRTAFISIGVYVSLLISER